jgi:hypothetical protein
VRLPAPHPISECGSLLTRSCGDAPACHGRAFVGMRAVEIYISEPCQQSLARSGETRDVHRSKSAASFPKRSAYHAGSHRRLSNGLRRLVRSRRRDGSALAARPSATAGSPSATATGLRRRVGEKACRPSCRMLLVGQKGRAAARAHLQNHLSRICTGGRDRFVRPSGR